VVRVPVEIRDDGRHVVAGAYVEIKVAECIDDGGLGSGQNEAELRVVVDRTSQLDGVGKYATRVCEKIVRYERTVASRVHIRRLCH